MKIYVGRWDLLPESWEGINGLYGKSEEEIRKEVYRQIERFRNLTDGDDPNIDSYTAKEFEAFFNGKLDDHISSEDYWIKIF